jgi:Trk K+ transport system NAD-binding subunit/Kef-type K+ transport system membrane component KefB
METLTDILIIVLVFGIILVSSNQIAKLVLYIKLPLITGLLLVGMIVGPEVLGMVSHQSLSKLHFIDHIALPFIAFAAGSELYFIELRSRMKIIKWMTTGQIVISFVLGTLGVFLLTGLPFFNLTSNLYVRIAISTFAGTIFVARSPASVIAVINELRAKGPFTRMVLGVTVLTDFLVVILFAIVISLVDSLLTEKGFSFQTILLIFTELIVSFGISYLLYLLFRWVLSLKLNTLIKAIIILGGGWSIHFIALGLNTFTEFYLKLHFYVEPLLVGIIASVLLTNYSPFRREFQKIIHDAIPIVYVAFFTLIGSSISVEVIIKTWEVTLMLVFLRIITLVIGGWVGGTLGGDPQRYNRIGWMPFVSQAGMSLGLITVIANKYPDWGENFASIFVSVIVLNQIIGPPLMKWAIQLVKESHCRATHKSHAGPLEAIIFGYEHQSLTLARQLTNHGWKAIIASKRKNIPDPGIKNIEIRHIPEISREELQKTGADEADAIVTLKKDHENLKICEIAYEYFGTPELIVRLNDREYLKKFHELGALIVDPTTAIVSLMDHLVRSPMATSLLLGMEEKQDTADIVIRNPDIHGLTLRKLHLPSDVLILSTRRRGHNIISTGYTRLRIGDTLTIVGSPESIEELRLRFE